MRRLVSLRSGPQLSPAMAEDSLIIRGAREHNLRNIDVTIPRDRLTVVTGLSGSGKSSLAFDTIYAEGQPIEVASPPKLNRRQNHTISVIVDRLAVRREDRGRLTDSVETALKLADGTVEVSNADTGTSELFSERYGCPTCGLSFPEL